MIRQIVLNTRSGGMMRHHYGNVHVGKSYRWVCRDIRDGIGKQQWADMNREERHNNIRLCLNDLEIETAVSLAA